MRTDQPLPKRAIVVAVMIALCLGWNSAKCQRMSREKELGLHTGMTITSSIRVARRKYKLPALPSPDSSIIIIRGKDITVDFSGATLEGMNPNSDPDSAQGVAIRIEGGKNIRILHARIRGYKIGILAHGTENLELVDVDVSYNWKPKLFSLIEHESLIDWLSFHHNEKSEWLRYGAGIYLDSVREGEVRDCRCVQGMNGLMLTRCDKLTISNNNFSFNSGLGVGLYRSTHNEIIHNRLDYNVRGYSHRFYHRGQDSADMLFFEQSSDNVVAFNSATHGGDGFFLWAGQTTMDSGTGGANDNVLYRNDFSFSTANGIEATFSRNTLIANRMEGCDYGVWGGYSFGSKIIANTFINNRTGIAIEHGQDNLIASNQFDKDTTAISLWANPIEPSEWGYPKHHDTKSRDYRIETNSFLSNRYGLKSANTSAISIVDNGWSDVDTMTVFRDTSNVQIEKNISTALISPKTPEIPDEYEHLVPKVAKGEDEIPGSMESRMDRSAIIVDEWGPYDYQSPKLWPADSSNSLPLRLRTLGPPGSWKVVGRRGVAKMSQSSGRIGDAISVAPAADSTGDWELTLEYKGKETVSPRGEPRNAGVPYRFSYTRFEPVIDWNVRFFKWPDSADPRTKSEAFDSILHAEPFMVRHEPRLDYEWYRPVIRELPLERWALEATGSVALAPGTYTLRTISDDGVRVWLDGVLVIDNWTQHGSMLDYATIAGGKHEMRVQFFQIDGWTEFRLDILRGITRSPGSPG